MPISTQAMLRLIKSLLVASVGLFFLFVGISNIEDPSANLEYIKHIFSMDTIYPDSPSSWRAITSPAVHGFVFWFIVVVEFVLTFLCLAGAARLALNIRASAEDFHKAKSLAILGLGIGILLWFTGFIVIGAEWFLMWQSEQWSGLQSAFRFAVMMLLILIFVASREE